MARQRSSGSSGGAQASSHHGRTPWRKPKQTKKHSSCSRCWVAFGAVSFVVGLLTCGIALYLHRYPSKQRCPSENDRFYEHCQEGRTHYVLKLDWDCLGARRSEAMRMALSLPSDGKPLVGIGAVPSWLTDANADTLRSSPCIQGVIEDKACWYCKPTPKPPSQDMDAKQGQGGHRQASGKAAVQPEGASATLEDEPES